MITIKEKRAPFVNPTPAKRQRKSGGNKSDAINSLADSNQLLIESRLQKPLSDSQVAIKDFQDNFKDKYSPFERLKFIKKVLGSESEAQVYNVLDNETKELYVKDILNQ